MFIFLMRNIRLPYNAFHVLNILYNKTNTLYIFIYMKKNVDDPHAVHCVRRKLSDLDLYDTPTRKKKVNI